jgi:hypothetical protein
MMRFAARVLLLVAAATAFGITCVTAQSRQTPATPPDAPPVAISGWRYEKGANGVHFFFCQHERCGSASKISYRLYALDNTMTLERYRGEQETIVKALQERMPAGTKITVLNIDGDAGVSLPRMYKTRRLHVGPDGRKEYVISGIVLGTRGAASLISSMADEKTNDGNYAQFALALALFLQVPRNQQKP